MDRVTDVLLEALRQALAEGGEQRLYRGGKLAGLFPARIGAAGEAASQALRDGLIEVVRTETKGRTVIEWVRLTPRGVEYLHQQESPLAALRELRHVLAVNGEALPAWLAEMKVSLGEVAERVEREARRWGERLDALSRRVDAAVARLEESAPRLPSDVADSVPWGTDALNYLDRRRNGGANSHCPLPELFEALAGQHVGLSVGDFHDGLRRLHERHLLRLAPADGEPLTRPEFALFDRGTLLYYTSR